MPRRSPALVLVHAVWATCHRRPVLRLAVAVRLADLMQHIKGGSAYDANRHPLLPQRLMWQAGYWAESLSPGDFDPLARYVHAQRLHHDPTHPAERWQFGDQ